MIIILLFLLITSVYMAKLGLIKHSSVLISINNAYFQYIYS